MGSHPFLPAVQMPCCEFVFVVVRHILRSPRFRKHLEHDLPRFPP